ncbi:MAG: hypothetical protein ASARMPRED_000599 [Alectoria sarmentosa]|nr:MAG: hypothetical protein ASARMPRED_000599 [Alectoria sarmentosa]
MPQAPAFTLSLSLIFLNLFPLYTSAAIILPPVPPNNDIPFALSPTAPLAATNISATPHGQIRCVLPYPHPIDPVNLRICQPTLDRLLSYPYANTPRIYRLVKGRTQPVKITSTVCAISLDRSGHDGDILISLGQIVLSVKRILASCSAHGEGGWQFVDPPFVDWIVVVEGTGYVEGGGKGTVGDLGETVAGGSEEE